MSNPHTILQARFRDALIAAFGPQYAGTDPLLRPAQNPQFGDYQANLAMSLAKALGQKPREVATKVVAALKWQDLCEAIPGVAGPGFINVKLSDAFLGACASAMSRDERLGVERASPAQTVVVDYSGPNVAKEMHVGHLRSTVIGDAVARVLAFRGHRVIRQNHLGDWGTQFGMLIEHLHDLDWHHTAEHSIRDLNALYQQSKAKFDSDDNFADRARRRVVALQAGDEVTKRLWRALIDESQAHFRSIYATLGVELTDADVRPESFYNPLLPGVVEELLQAGHARQSDGAICVFPDGFVGPKGDPIPLIVRKSDGGFGYAATDLAALRYRTGELGAQRVVYVVDARQKQHLAMVFAAAALAGWVTPEVRVEHVMFGTVLGEDNRPFKTRSGETVKLVDLLEEAQQRALELVTAKNPQLSDEQRKAVARAVGIGAIKYADLCNDRVKDYVFSWPRMLAFDGNTAPYLQNAFVRIRSIFRKAGDRASGIGDRGGEILVREAQERALVLKLLQLPGVIEGVAASLEPHRLCTYLYELAAGYHQFYEACPVLTAPDDATRSSRLRLSDLTARTLSLGLDLLGIQTLEQM